MTPSGRMRQTFFGQARAVDHVHDDGHIFVSCRLLFVKPSAVVREGEDALLLEFLADRAVLRGADGGGPREQPPGAVAGRAEGLLHRARLPDEQEGIPAHVAGDDDRLADAAIRPPALPDGPAGKARVAPLRWTQSVRSTPPTLWRSSLAMLCATS